MKYVIIIMGVIVFICLLALGDMNGIKISDPEYWMLIFAPSVIIGFMCTYIVVECK